MGNQIDMERLVRAMEYIFDAKVTVKRKGDPETVIIQMKDERKKEGRRAAM